MIVGFMIAFASCSKDYNGPIDPVTGLPSNSIKGSENNNNTSNESDTSNGITDGGESSDWYGPDGKKKKKP